MKKAIFPGSFDPFTVGHMDILKRALTMFDWVSVCIIPNPAKHSMFTEEERKMLIGRAIAAEGLTCADVVCYRGLTVDCANALDAGFILRGIRDAKDFEYERELEYYNKYLSPNVQTVYLACDAAHTHISSSAVRELVQHKADIGPFVPKDISEFIAERYKSDEQ